MDDVDALAPTQPPVHQDEVGHQPRQGEEHQDEVDALAPTQAPVEHQNEHVDSMAPTQHVQDAVDEDDRDEVDPYAITQDPIVRENVEQVDALAPTQELTETPKSPEDTHQSDAYDEDHVDPMAPTQGLAETPKSPESANEEDQVDALAPTQALAETPNSPESQTEEDQVDPTAPTQAIADTPMSPEDSRQSPSNAADQVDPMAPTQALPDTPLSPEDCQESVPNEEERSEDHVDPMAPTQALPETESPNSPSHQETRETGQSVIDEGEGIGVDAMAPTQAVATSPKSPQQGTREEVNGEEVRKQGEGEVDGFAPTQDLNDDDSFNKESGDAKQSTSVEGKEEEGGASRRSRSKSGSRSRSVSSRSSVGSRSSSGSRSRSRSRSRSVSRSRSKSRSRSVDSRRSAGSRRSRSSSSNASAVSRKSVSSSGSSRSRSPSAGPVDDDDNNIVRSKKRSRETAALSDDENNEESEPKGDNEESQEKRARVEESGEAPDASENPPEGQQPVSSEDEDQRPGNSSEFVSDFDLMLEKKRAEQRRRRRRKDIDLINDNDDAIAKMIADMRLAAREDRDLNLEKMPATKKISMLPVVMAQLRKADLQMAFVEANVLSVLTDWLAPLPDKSLPSKEIRRQILKLLSEIKIDEHARLKESGIGKAVMYLYKHPKELREHKDLAGKIINAWARPIFGLSTDFKSVSKDVLMERDQAVQVSGAGRRRGQDNNSDVEHASRPGERGWSYRARVPQVDTNTYVRRPEWTSTVDMSSRRAKREMSKLDKHIKAAQDRKRMAKDKRAVHISIEGRKMNL